GERLTLERNVEIVTDSDKKKIVRIHDTRFNGKRSIGWRQVRDYLKDYVGASYEIAETKDIIYIGFDLPDEYTGSRYTYKLMGHLQRQRLMQHKEFLNFRHSAEGKKYLYVLNIKKKRATLSAHNELTRHKTHFSLTET
ncbi:MAG: XRE family transcriptional regulator, partial [Lachnospiraceae bacterium]|nr:XRE family transcriptional regulator [Lachnospiraceae bacterium]